MTIFDHLRQCAANGDTPTLDAEDAARIVKIYDMLLDALEKAKVGLRYPIYKAIAFARNPTL